MASFIEKYKEFKQKNELLQIFDTEPTFEYFAKQGLDPSLLYMLQVITLKNDTKNKTYFLGKHLEKIMFGDFKDMSENGVGSVYVNSKRIVY